MSLWGGAKDVALNCWWCLVVTTRHTTSRPNQPPIAIPMFFTRARTPNSRYSPTSTGDIAAASAAAGMPHATTAPLPQTAMTPLSPRQAW